jgi:hypothetical protein
MNSPTWALVTESSQVRVLMSDDFELLKNIQLIVSRSVLLTVVDSNLKKLSNNSASPELVENINFVKDVLVAQREFYAQIDRDYFSATAQELLALELREKFFNKILPNDQFFAESIRSEVNNITSYKRSIELHDALVSKTLFNLDYTKPLAHLKETLIHAVTDISKWDDVTDRYFVYGRLSNLFVAHFK